jgi:serine protease AprX
LAAFLALALIVAALPGTNWTAAPTDPDLAAGDYALVQVTHGTADAVAAKATAAGATDVASLDKLDLVTARLSADALRSLQTDSRVFYLAADALVEAAGAEDRFEKAKGLPSPGVRVIDADQAWSRETGRGVTVAVMDTGIAEHPDLRDSVVARVDFVNDGTTLLDPSGHGTFLAGLIAAHGETFRGVAPDAKLVSLRVLDQKGKGSMHAVLAAFDWLLRNRTAMHIKVLNLSFGAPQRSSYHRELLAGVVESAWFSGVTVVAAAGNEGRRPSRCRVPIRS